MCWGADSLYVSFCPTGSTPSPGVEPFEFHPVVICPSSVLAMP